MQSLFGESISRKLIYQESALLFDSEKPGNFIPVILYNFDCNPDKLHHCVVKATTTKNVIQSQNGSPYSAGKFKLRIYISHMKVRNKIQQP